MPKRKEASVLAVDVYLSSSDHGPSEDEWMEVDEPNPVQMAISQAELRTITRQLNATTAWWKQLKAAREHDEREKKERAQHTWEAETIETDVEKQYKQACKEVTFENHRE